MQIKIYKAVKEMQHISEQLRNQGKIIAVVPTMGSLHKGHLALIEKAKSLSDIVITTIFVNPTQFGPNEDFECYPRNFEKDKLLASEAGTNIIFAPEVSDMYPNGFCSKVEVEGVPSRLEGFFRPQHFSGVTTVVAKLFNITKPHIAIFGQKDVQQVFIIKKMIQDLNMDVQIVVADIVRENDGLAMSSRNVYLNNDERIRALSLYRSLQYASNQLLSGNKNIAEIKNAMNDMIMESKPSKIDYIAFINPDNFSEIDNANISEILITLAVRYGSTRLIDNTIIKMI